MHGRLNWDHVLLGVDGRVSIIGMRTHSNTNLFSFPRTSYRNLLFDWRSDQWSIGAIFASLLLKESLYTGRPNPEYAASRGDVTHWLDRIKVAYPAAYRVVAKMLHPAAGERYGHHSYILRDLERLRDIHPNTKRTELGEALGVWLQSSPQQSVHSVDLILPNRVLPQVEPKLQKHVLEVTEQLEPEIDSYIEVTQFNTPKFSTGCQRFNVGDYSRACTTFIFVSTCTINPADDPNDDIDITEVSEDVPAAQILVFPIHGEPFSSSDDSKQPRRQSILRANRHGRNQSFRTFIATLFASGGFAGWRSIRRSTASRSVNDCQRHFSVNIDLHSVVLNSLSML